MSSETEPKAAANERAHNIVVTEMLSLKPVEKGTRPAHHADDHNGKFRNPWESFRSQTTKQIAGHFLTGLFNSPAIPKEDALNTLIPVQAPTWGKEPENATKLKATWLGHSTFLVELPTPPGAARGPRILFDPALSPRCSAVGWAGPSRFTNVPCDVLDIPVVDAIVISHNHYDHMDAPTLSTLRERDNPHIFSPLGNDMLMMELGFRKDRRHCLDWWDSRAIAVYLPAEKASAAPVHATFKLICTPAQHSAGRSLFNFDQWRSLWASWAIEGDSPSASVFFAGDTGYRTVLEGENEDTVPCCPAFKEIGERIGGFELALLPIGGYGPRSMRSCMHSSPSDSVRIFQDVKARHALGMHWGTWSLTTEPIMEPPQKLKEACGKAGLAPDVFDVCGLGNTRVF